MARTSPESTAKLIALARDTKGDTLGALLDQYRNYLYLIARTQVDLHLAVRTSPSDLVQETFLQAAKEFEDFQGATNAQLMAWLRRILINNIVAAYHRHVLAHKRDVRREWPLESIVRTIDQSSAFIEQALADSADQPDARMIREEQAAYVADILADLPRLQREVIILRNLEGLPFEQVADRMGRSQTAVRKLWTRAICRLKLVGQESQHE